MGEFNYKDYIANNPLLKEGKELEFPEGLESYLKIHKLILNDTPKDIFNKMTSSERNDLEKVMKQWEEITEDLKTAVTTQSRTKFKNQLENVEDIIKKKLESFYKRINYDPKEEARKKDEKDKKEKAERDRKSSISYDLKKMRDEEAEDALSEAKLDFMGTADEETMKYLQEISREELLALEKQFVDMFNALGVIRYNASDQLSKGASEISQRIHNFITIFRQAIKGYPVVREENKK